MRGALLAVAAGIATGLLLLTGWRLLHEAPVPDGGPVPVLFKVEPGEGFASVAGRLEEQGLVVSARRLRILARLTRADRAIQAGTYLISTGTRPDRVLDDLVEGRVRLTSLTIPEGWRIAQMAREVERVLDVPAEDFLEAASDSVRLRRMSCPTENLEGYLFPDTYRFPDEVAAGEIVDAMLHRFQEVWDSLPADRPDSLDRHGIVTLASIVEAETGLDEEKPHVAAVYLNRLRMGWRLQADPTVRYGLGRFTGRLYYKHLDIDTPYNTYRHYGLPPGPIGAPGREALLAVLRPLDPCDDLFFVAAGTGSGHVFSRTSEEHAKAKLEARVARDLAAELAAARKTGATVADASAPEDAAPADQGTAPTAPDSSEAAPAAPGGASR